MEAVWAIRYVLNASLSDLRTTEAGIVDPDPSGGFSWGAGKVGLAELSWGDRAVRADVRSGGRLVQVREDAVEVLPQCRCVYARFDVKEWAKVTFTPDISLTLYSANAPRRRQEGQLLFRFEDIVAPSHDSEPVIQVHGLLCPRARPEGHGP